MTAGQPAWIEGAPARDGQAWWGLFGGVPRVFIAGQVFDRQITHHAPYTTGQSHPELPGAEWRLPSQWKWERVGGQWLAAVEGDGGVGVARVGPWSVRFSTAAPGSICIDHSQLAEVCAIVRQRNGADR